MKDLLMDEVEKFIAQRWQAFTRPFLLAYSGGPDSKALLYLLLECQRCHPFDLRLVHVDHGWRKESGSEAEGIVKEAEELGLPVHLKRLEGAPSSNLEDWGRKARRDYFKEVYDLVDAAGIFLAHQADDQAETLLKRLFEGAHPSRWGAMAPDAERQGMRLLRPLLRRSKEELTQWLSCQGKRGFEDPTNTDPRFLRGRMRTALIPLLAKQFGKEILKNLCRAAAASRDMEAYLARRCSPLLDLQRWVGGDLYWDLGGGVDPVELHWALKSWADQFCVQISRETLESIGAALQTPGLCRRFITRKGVIEVKNGVLILIIKSD